MKIIKKDIEIMKVLEGNTCDLYSFKYSDEKSNEFIKFLSKYSKYAADPLYSAFQKLHTAIYVMLEETGFKDSFFKKYEHNKISRIRQTDNLRLYGIEINEKELLLSSGGRKLKGKRGYQTSPLLFRQVKILESLRVQIFDKFLEYNVGTIKELLAINSQNAKFTISYEDELE